MFPQPPTQIFGSPNAAGPEGLEQGVAKLFPAATPPPQTEPEFDPYLNLDRKALIKRGLVRGTERTWLGNAVLEADRHRA